MPHPRPARRAARGLTLVESLVTVAVLGILASVAIPSIEPMRERRHLEGTAAQLETDIHWARSLAVARNEVVRLALFTTAGGSCYVVHSGPAGSCDCRADGEVVCQAAAEPLRRVHLGGLPVRLQGNSASMAFDPVKGTITPTGTLRVIGRGGAAIHQVVNVMGRVRSCSPGGAVAGMPAC